MLTDLEFLCFSFNFSFYTCLSFCPGGAWMPCIPPAMHAPCHAHLLPHAPLPCMPSCHACPHHAHPLPCMPLAMHAPHHTSHAPLPCRPPPPCMPPPPAMYGPLPCMPHPHVMRSMTGRYASCWSAFLFILRHQFLLSSIFPQTYERL